jgi:hypothetical protein
MNNRLQLNHQNIKSPKTGLVGQKWYGNTYAIKDEAFKPFEPEGRAWFLGGTWYTMLDADELANIYRIFNANVVMAPMSAQQTAAIAELVEEGYVTAPAAEDLAKMTYKQASAIISGGRELRKLDQMVAPIPFEVVEDPA